MAKSTTTTNSETSSRASNKTTPSTKGRSLIMTRTSTRNTPKKPAAATDRIPLAEYAARRSRVLKELGNSAAIVLAGNADGESFTPDAHFLYLTGIDDESGAVLLFNSAAPDPKRRIVLFLRPMNPEVDRWSGHREELSAGLRDRYGFSCVLRTTHLPGMLMQAARRTRSLACLHPFAPHTQPVGEDLVTYRKVCERGVGISVADTTNMLPSMRSIKSAAELKLMRHAMAITGEALADVAQLIAPGGNEGEVSRRIAAIYAQHGAGHAFDPIVASGINATVLHYHANRAPLLDGQLMVIDTGAKFGGLCADVTRTFPISGRFDRRQRAIYDAVLTAHEAAIKAVRPGVWMHEVEAAARDVLRAASLDDFMVHSIGHQLGTQVHDADPIGPLKAGQVITIEPGVYLPEQKLGIRIEDDVLVTTRGSEVMTASIPREADAIERAMQ